MITDFLKVFDSTYAGLLEYRAPTFRYCIAALPERPIVVETGCVNDLGCWRGHGQSTLMFDLLVYMTAGKFYSVDINEKSTKLIATYCHNNTTIHCGDSVKFLEGYSHEPIDLLYLDSFDLDRANPLPAAQHGLRELKAAWPHLHEGSIVCVDDTYITNGQPLTGKGMLIDEHMKTHGIKKVMQYYQAVWVL